MIVPEPAAGADSPRTVCLCLGGQALPSDFYPALCRGVGHGHGVNGTQLMSQSPPHKIFFFTSAKYCRASSGVMPSSSMRLISFKSFSFMS